jgi:hypothetical protein
MVPVFKFSANSCSPVNKHQYANGVNI